MKDVGGKPETLRKATAEARLFAPGECLAMVATGHTEKGDPRATARVAGTLAAKRTDELIPLCHPLPLHHADVTFTVEDDAVRVEASVETIGPTGVEMEALTAANMAALTLYDMLKPHTDPEHLWIADCRLISKTGGKSQFKRRLRFTVPATVIVLSDTVAAGKKPDTAGHTVSEGLMDAGFEIADYRVVPDEPAEVEAAIRAQLDAAVPLIVTVGSTGLGERDCAVEVAGQLIDTEIPGLMETARAFGQRRTPYAMLSRGVAGLAGDSVLATFPGSRKGAVETLDALLAGLIHVFEVRRGVSHAQGYR